MPVCGTLPKSPWVYELFGVRTKHPPTLIIAVRVSCCFVIAGSWRCDLMIFLNV